MRRFSFRARLGAVTTGLLVLVVAVIVLGNNVGSSRAITPREIASGSAAPGARVRLVGKVVSSDRDSVVLAPEDASTPTVRVTLADTAVGRATFGSGVVVGVEGVVTGSRSLAQATLLFPSGPSKYRARTSGSPD